MTRSISNIELQDTQMSTVNHVLPILLSIDTFITHVGLLNSTFGTVFRTNNAQDTNIMNINNTSTSFLQTSGFDDYQITGNSTLHSVINTNATQDASINDLLNTLPSYLQSATASATYQPGGE